MRMNLLLVPVVAALVATTASRAAAEPVVLAVDGDDIYVDLGAKDGVGAGTELELLHEIVAKDPRTGAVLRDRFALGTLAVEKSGDKLSVAHAAPALAKRVLAGDHVRLVSAPRKFVDPWAEQVLASRSAGGGPVVPSPPVGPVSPTGPDHTDLTRQAWESTLGQPPEARIARWTALLTADPKNPYRKVIENEIASLRAQVVARDEALARASSQSMGDRNPRIARLAEELPGSAASRRGALALAPLAHVAPGQPLELAFLVRMPSAIGQAWLFVRPAGEPGFRRIDLLPDGDAYLRATVEAAAVRAPRLEWYVEAKGRGDRR